MQLTEAIDFYRKFSPMAAALQDAKETLASGAALARKNARLFFSTINAAHQSWDLYNVFANSAQTAASAAQTTSCVLPPAMEFFFGVSLGQTLYGIGRSGFGLYKCANSLKEGDINGGIFHGLIYTPGKIAGTVASSMRAAQEIIILEAGHAAPVFAIVGAAASLAQSVFLVISGFYQIYNACVFSQELNEAKNPGQYLFEQAFIRNEEKLNEIEQLGTESEKQKAIEMLLKQQKENFIRRTTSECYNETVQHFFKLPAPPDLHGDEVPPVGLSELKALYKKQENLNPSFQEKVLQYNFQTKMVAAIKIASAILAGAACIALLVFTGGLGLIAVAGILLIITGLLRAGSNATEMQQAIGDFVWTYQKHRILPEHFLQNNPNEEQQKTIQQVKFVALTLLGAITFPIWIVPASIGFQIKGALAQRPPVQTIPHSPPV